MKNIKNIILGVAAAAALGSCVELDRYPLDQGSSETWFSNPKEYELAINDMYRNDWWVLAKEAWSDDYIYRKVAGPDIVDGTLNSETDTDGSVKLDQFWTNQYKAIVRANVILASLHHGAEAGVRPELLESYEAQARFARGCHYATLVFHFGDVVYVENATTIEESYRLKRTPKAEIIEKVYSDLDFAAKHLEKSYAGKQIATKGAALAMKARFALWFGDYDICAAAAKECMELDVYRLHPDYGEYFHARNDKESIFVLPTSSALQVNTLGDSRSYVQRMAGGFASKCPSWAIFASYECVDGKTIDESPLFDGENPFANRDPRCAASIIEFGTENFGYEFNPRPSATQVMNYTTGKMQKNTDNFPIGNANSSYSGLVWKKRVEASWSTPGMTDNDNIIIRLADVMLMYAEAKIELNQIDQSVLDAINKVRARAYKVDYTETTSYPAITVTDQTALRKIIRRERRVELAFEGLRYYDLIRWRIAKKALNMPNCGIPSDKKLAKQIEDEGHWFWAVAPTFDEDGIPNFQALIDARYCEVHSKGNFSDRMYLWPIPSKEILINPNLAPNNPGY
ncbi:MAG: RagB/SusD family nutrient uptake outer membrane protein [Muribaculaceae bacterium]|jgi:hypothetical protein